MQTTPTGLPETRTSTCRSFATNSSGLYRFLAIAVLLDVKDIPKVGTTSMGVNQNRHAFRSEPDILFGNERNINILEAP
jgi:hypothetical protein